MTETIQEYQVRMEKLVREHVKRVHEAANSISRASFGYGIPPHTVEFIYIGHEDEEIEVSVSVEGGEPHEFTLTKEFLEDNTSMKRD